MGFIGGKNITVSPSLRRGSSDLVIREETRHKIFLIFLSRQTAKEVMLLGEDLLMKPLALWKEKRFEEQGRAVSISIVSNRRDRSLSLQSTSKNAKNWRRRVFVPEGRFGEGWLSLARQIKDVLRQYHDEEIQEVSNYPAPIPKEQESAWVSIPAQSQGPNRFGLWAFMVVCRVHSKQVDWPKISLRIANLVDKEIEFSPFDSTLAIIKTSSLEEQDLLCSQILDDSDGFSLVPWRPGINGRENLGFSVGGWIGLTGLPFHLWNHVVFSDIGNLFGGLELVDESDLSMAKLKIRGVLAWIPSRIDIQEGDEVFQLEVRLIQHSVSSSPSNFISPALPSPAPGPLASEFVPTTWNDEEETVRDTCNKYSNLNLDSCPKGTPFSRMDPVSDWEVLEEEGTGSTANSFQNSNSKRVGTDQVGPNDPVPSISPDLDSDNPVNTLMKKRLSVGLELGLTFEGGNHKLLEMFHRSYIRDEFELAQSKQVVIDTLPDELIEEEEPQTPLVEFSSETPVVVFQDKIGIEWWEDSQIREDFLLEDSDLPDIPPGFESQNPPPPGFETVRSRRKALRASLYS